MLASGRVREYVVKKGRAFTPMMSCLCCMGGNCYRVGHVIPDCSCCCVEYKECGNSSEKAKARQFKQEYVSQEQEFERNHKRKVTSTENCLLIKLLSPQAKVPTRGSESAAGYDLYSAETVLIPAGTRKLIDMGIAVTIPAPQEKQLYGRIAPRFGLSIEGLDIGAGVIDSDYRGPVKILLINNSSVPFQVNQGDRTAQLILERIESPTCILVDSLPETLQGSKGFGSTGVSHNPGKFLPVQTQEEIKLPSSCRKFFNDGEGRCRVEHDICGRERCYCQQSDSRWNASPFVSEQRQLRWVIEFYQYINTENQPLQPDFAAMAITEIKRGTRRKNPALEEATLGRLPSGVIV